MPRYFFHVASGKTWVNDKNGYDFPCAADAHLYARRVVLGTQPYLNKEDGRWSIRIQSPDDEEFELIVLFPAPRSVTGSTRSFGRRGIPGRNC